MKRPKIERRDIDVEVVKCRERGKEDVELAFAPCFGNRPGHVCILENECGLLDLEMVERSAGSTHGSGKVSLPIIGKRFAVQSAQQIEIDGRRLQLDVLHR